MLSVSYCELVLWTYKRLRTLVWDLHERYVSANLQISARQNCHR